MKDRTGPRLALNGLQLTGYVRGAPLCGLCVQDYTGLGNELGRQLLRTRRSFTATVFSADGARACWLVPLRESGVAAQINEGGVCDLHTQAPRSSSSCGGPCT